MGQPVAMFEIISNDHEKLSTFYSELFGWTVNQDPSWGDYRIIDTAAAPVSLIGGIGPSQSAGDTGVKIYVRVDDLAAWLDKAEQLGGARLVEPTPLPGDFGAFAMFADPDGNAVGLWT